MCCWEYPDSGMNPQSRNARCITTQRSYNETELCAPSLQEGLLSSSPRWKLRFPIQCTKLLEMKDPTEDTERMDYLNNEKLCFWWEWYKYAHWQSKNTGAGSLYHLMFLRNLTLHLDLDWSKSKAHNFLKCLKFYINLGEVLRYTMWQEMFLGKWGLAGNWKKQLELQKM
jgi:hypothetical protein